MHSSEDHQNKLEVFHQYRNLLFSIAYRMLGTVVDAEDVLQETFIRWQESTDADVQSPRAYLVTIISRLCINQLQSARVQREEYIGQWLPEPLVTGPSVDPFSIFRVDESLFDVLPGAAGAAESYRESSVPAARSLRLRIFGDCTGS